MFAPQPGPAADALRQGLLALQSNQPEEASRDFEIAVQIDPKNVYAWTALAQARWRLNDKPKALTSAETAAHLISGNVRAAHALAMFYTEAQNFKDAARFERLYAESPSADPAALARAADLYLNAGDPSQALELARQSYQANASPANRNLLGRALLATNDVAGALPNLAAASVAQPTDEILTFDYVQALFRQGDFATAVDALHPAIAAHPSSAQLELAYGVACYGQRRFPDAVDAFLKTIAINPAIEQPYVFLGKMLEQAGPRLPEITRAYEAWDRAAPHQYLAPFLLGKALLAADPASPEGEHHLRDSIARKPDFWQSHFELGQFLEKRRDFPNAALEFQTSTALNPEEPMPHYHLARVYDRLGETQKAAAEREIHAKLTATRKDPSTSGMSAAPARP